MVDALREIHRVLIPDGMLIDLRPVLNHWKIEVASEQEVRETGRMQDFDLGRADDEAANRSIAQAGANGWFVREQEESFPFLYSWDSPNEMEAWIKEEWEGFIGLEEDALRRTRSAWALGNADSRVRVKMEMSIARWRRK